MTWSWTGKTVLITGVGGFIGAWLAEALLARGARVTGFDQTAPGALLLHEGLNENVEVALGSITSPEDAQRAFDRFQPEVCFHLAGASMVDRSIASPVATFEVNALGTWVILEAARQAASTASIVVASSNHVYGNHETFPYSEDYALNGPTPYAASKACADIVARSYAATYGLPIGVARLTNSYGGADPHLTHIVTATILAVLRGDPPVIHSDGSPLKSYLYVKDTIAGLIRLAETASSSAVRGRAFNLCTDEPVRVLDLVQTIIDVSGVTELRPRVLARPGDSHDREFLSNERAKAILGWHPAFTLEAGVREAVAWYREHPLSWQTSTATRSH